MISTSDILGIEPFKSPSAVTFGTFDGVHIGHQKVIGKMIKVARENRMRSVILSFYPHPRSFIDPENAPGLLTPSRKKLEIFESLGIDFAILAKLEPELAEKSGREFIEEILVGKLRASHVVVGADAAYGNRRSGDVDLLRRMGRELHFTVDVVSKATIDGRPVSSTRIRNAIHRGDLALAERMLGRRYAILGTVVPGDKLGRKLGFPTANLDIDGQVLPPFGVYAVRVRIAGSNGKPLFGMMNIGRRPTFGGDDVRIEVHILDFDLDIYGNYLEAELLGRIRGEMRFDSAEALIDQMKRDESTTRRLISSLETGTPSF